MRVNIFQDFDEVMVDIVKAFKEEATDIPVGHWQGLILDLEKVPGLNSHEVFNYSFNYQPLSAELEFLREQIKPNLPWADDHFEERVGREPINPGKQYLNWPFYNKNSDQEGVMRKGGQFNHNYMERFWPKHAGQRWGTHSAEPVHHGIRYDYGDLDDVVNLLVRQPLTRQAYFPIFFPEDTGAVHGGRVPCTLGYHFVRRESRLHIFYLIRSCDLFRHFRDDVYMAYRLLLWVLDELKRKDPATWSTCFPGTLSMQIFSLHIFKGEAGRLKRL